jgi:hypothetical protein
MRSCSGTSIPAPCKSSGASTPVHCPERSARIQSQVGPTRFQDPSACGCNSDPPTPVTVDPSRSVGRLSLRDEPRAKVGLLIADTSPGGISVSEVVDRRWLEWAGPIVRGRDSNDEHFTWCEGMLGLNRYADIDQTLRWPGYVGANWELGRGILFIGSVHSEFAGTGDDPASRAPVVAALAAANARWRSAESPSRADDSNYLEATRSAYASLMPYWPRAEVFRCLMAGVLGDQEDLFSHAAWTNLAHCRSKPKAIREYPLQLRCSSETGAYPIGDLIRRLWPAAILVSVLPVATTYPHRYDLLGDGYAEERPPGYDHPGHPHLPWDGSAGLAWSVGFRLGAGTRGDPPIKGS